MRKTLSKSKRAMEVKVYAVRVGNRYGIEFEKYLKDKIPDINKKYFNDVKITHIQGSPLKDLIDTSEAVLNNNLNPVPHLPARSMESENDLNFLLNKLTKLGVSDLSLIHI